MSIREIRLVGGKVAHAGTVARLRLCPNSNESGDLAISWASIGEVDIPTAEKFRDELSELIAQAKKDSRGRKVKR